MSHNDFIGLNYLSIAASWYKEDVMTLMKEALKEGGLTTLSDSYAINGQPGDFYDCSNGTQFIPTNTNYFI